MSAKNTNETKVLVVDDSRVMRAALKKYLKNEFAISEADDGEQGWDELTGDAEINVVITDVEMPRLDGYSFICRIRASDEVRIRDIPVIVITGADDETTRERAYACGATDFITKPIDSNQLLAHVHAQAKVDETAIKLAESTISLAEQATLDPLTQLSSHRNLLQRGEQDLAYAKRRMDEFSVVRIDIDNFKPLHDEHGDEIAQKVLVWLAGILKDKTRTEDTVARIKGAEFAILAPSAGRLEIAVLCERLRAGVEEKPFKEGSLSTPITVSIGLVTLGRDKGDTIEDLLQLAEKRVRAARAAGGNRLGVSDGDEDEGVDEPVIAQPSIERALLMLADNKGGDIIPYLPELTLKIIPLLEIANDKLNLEMDFEIKSLKEKLESMD